MTSERVWRRALARGARAGILDRLERLLRGGPRVRRLDTLTRRLVQRRPDDGTARLFRARQLVRDGRIDDAAAELAQVPPPWSSLPGYHALLAELHVRRGAHEDAVTAFRHALADEWRGFCSSCGSFGSYQSNFELADGAGPPSAMPAATPPTPIP